MNQFYTKCEDHFDYCVYRPTTINDMKGYTIIDYEDKKVLVKDLILNKYKENLENGIYKLDQIPKMLRTLDICKIAINIDSSNIRHVPECVINNELCIAAITHSGLNLQYIPEKFKTAKLCILALIKNPIFEAIPKELNIQLLVDASHVELPDSTDDNSDRE